MVEEEIERLNARSEVHFLHANADLLFMNTMALSVLEGRCWPLPRRTTLRFLA